jgi:small subunit ribosomal protein S9
MADEKQGDEPVNEPDETPAAPEEPTAEETPAQDETPAPEETPAASEEPTPAAETPAETPAASEEPAAADDTPAATPEAQEVTVEGDEVLTDEDLEDIEERPREKPAIPGADLEVDIVREGDDVLRGESRWDEDMEDEATADGLDADELEPQPIADAAIDLAAGARYTATGKRKTAVARVILKPGDGAYIINGRTLEQHFPRNTLQRTIRQPLETVGYESRMDVVATMHGGGVSAQAGALRHGISRALIEADPNLRSELKRRGFLTRDARVKERKKAGLKKARKRPQFSKR